MTMTDTTDYSQYLTPREAAELLGLRLSTIQQLACRGTLQTQETRLGRFLRLDSVESYRDNHLGKLGRKKK